VAETFIDDLAQPIFRQAHKRGQRADGQPLATIGALDRHQTLWGRLQLGNPDQLRRGGPYPQRSLAGHFYFAR
jgi:hypothetical protein